MAYLDNNGKSAVCPCGSNIPYEKCCQPLHNRQLFAQSAEQLMRSRFCAFATGEWPYLLDTTHPQSTEPSNLNELEDWGSSKIWCSLKIIKTRQGRSHHQTGDVEFVAFYQHRQSNDSQTRTDTQRPILHQHHEHSLFKRIDSKWMFTQGTALDPIKINRNDPCPCNSGKKAKKCCLT